MTTPSMPPISKTGNDRVSKILFWVGILIIPTILIIQVLVYQPFFAHFDDPRKIRPFDEGLPLDEILTQFAVYEFSDIYGYVGSKATSNLILIPQYFLGASLNPISTYIVNAVLVTALITFFIFIFCNVLWSERSQNLSLSLTCGVVASFLWPFNFELIFFPSLQEKGVLLGALLAFFALLLLAKSESAVIFWLAALIALVVGLTVKSQISLFMPGLITALAVVQGRKMPNIRVAGLGVIFMILFFVPLIATRLGSYSGAQRSGDLASNFRATYATLILGIVVVYGVYVGVRFLRGSRNYLELVPLVMMATFWASIVYFGYRNYFLSIFGVMFGSAVAVVVGNLKSVRLQQLATVGLIVVTVGWTLYRIPQVFEPLHGIGAFTQGQIAKDLADEGAVIYTSCVEGSGHFNYYTERKWGVTPDFKPLEGDAAGYRYGIPDDGQYVFGDRRLCAAPGEIAAWDVVWASPGDDGFRLYKRPA